MKKKVAACMTAVCLAATAVGASVSLAGCGKSGDKFPTVDSDPTANLDIMLLSNSTERVFYNKYFEQMAEKYEIKITFEGLEEKPYYDRLDSRMQQGDVPDIFYVRPNEIMAYHKDIYCLEQFKDTVADNENLNLDLSDIYPLALDMYRFNDETNQMDEVNGELYAFPKDLSTQQLGYNKTIVEKYTTQIKAALGNDFKLPWEMNFKTENYTWAQYRTMCEVIANNLDDGYWASDVPDIEILAKSFGGSILNTNDLKVTITSEAVTKAINYQKDLVTSTGTYGAKPAADHSNATQEKFKGGKVAFYGAVGSWEVGDYDTAFGQGNWDVMPWPTEDGSTNWYGKITSAGYVVSNQCKNWQVAMEIAASFMTTKVQTQMMRDDKVSIPMNVKLQNDYLNPENDDKYSPKTRSVFIDVIKGTTHSFRPAEYYTYGDGWLKPFNDELAKMWTNKSYAINDTLQKDMQRLLDDYKNMY